MYPRVFITTFILSEAIEALPRSMRVSTRILRIFGMLVSFGPLTLGGCPRQSISGKDVHNDKEALRNFNPRYLRKPVWDDFGINLLQYWQSLAFGVWHASKAFTAEEIAKSL